MINILWRNMKWRYKNPLSIGVTILQPVLWLIIYSSIAGQTMKSSGIDNYTAFILPGIIVLVTFSSCSSGGIINFIMKNSGSFSRILIAPVKRSHIVLGQMLEAIITSFFEILILFIISLFYGTRVSSGFLGIIMIVVLMFMTGFVISGLAYTISLMLPNEVIYETIMNAIVLPIFFLSTALFPIDNITGALRIVILINPFTHIINNVRNLIFYQQIDYNSILPIILIFLILSILSFLLANRRLIKEMDY